MSERPRPDLDYEVRPILESDAGDLARVHLEAFPGFFLATLGRDVLESMYRAYASYSDGISIGVFRNGRACGAAVGYPQDANFYRFLARSEWAPLSRALVRASLSKPLTIWRIMRRLRQGAPDTPGAVLLASICVDPATAGRGVGGVLLDSWTGCAAQVGRMATLSTDTNDNARTISFYENHGWRAVESRQTTEGRSLTYMWRVL